MCSSDLERQRLIDEAPTYAAILGVDLPTAEGIILKEIIQS